MTVLRSSRGLLSASATYTFGDFLASGISGFLLIPLYLRYMPPAEYGLFSTVTVMGNMLGMLMGLGLSSAIARFYFTHRAEGNEYAYLGGVWLFQVLFAVATAVALAIWAQPLWTAISPAIPFRPYIWYVLASGTLAFSGLVLSVLLRVQERSTAFVVVQVTGILVLVTFVVVFVAVMHMGARGALLAAIVWNAFLGILALVALGRKVRWTLAPDLIGPSLSYGAWMVIGTLGFFFLNRAQLFFVQHYLNLASVGVYTLGQQLGGLVILFSNSFGKAWQPLVYSAPTPGEASAAIARASKPFVAAILFGSLAIALFSNEILLVVGGHRYAGASAIIRVVAIASFVYALGHLTNTALLYMKQAGLTQAALLAAAALNVVLSIVLIPRLGSLGAALAMLAAFCVMSFTGFVLAQRVLPVEHDWKGLTRIVGVAAALLLLEWLLVPQAVGVVPTTSRAVMLASVPLLLAVSGAFTTAEVNAARALAVRTLRLSRNAS
jgi:O-antigen/teichoic acid export membrane protein